VHSLRRGVSEAIEVVAHGDNKTSRVVGRRLDDLKLPPGTTVGVLIRGDELLFDKETIVQDGDHVIMFVADKRYIATVEKLFQVGIHFF
jgi:trk system potassium uptake protein TrkA